MQKTVRLYLIKGRWGRCYCNLCITYKVVTNQTLRAASELRYNQKQVEESGDLNLKGVILTLHLHKCKRNDKRCLPTGSGLKARRSKVRPTLQLCRRWGTRWWGPGLLAPWLLFPPTRIPLLLSSTLYLMSRKQDIQPSSSLSRCINHLNFKKKFKKCLLRRFAHVLQYFRVRSEGWPEITMKAFQSCI